MTKISIKKLAIQSGFKNNDEVVVPSFTFIATANAVLFVNSTPKFADIEEQSFGLDPNDVYAKINI